ncbi:hypothetical protein AVEN_170211-1 [Araneus ventricosus]|uniref:Uncharacterized protein n=1 Tax=Araneus ventricosus TaxID=182803 RepID=A0A4Y2WT95_ARAVE|nr:hypothetical protein AVEN_229431-1 [Araneus ventricosus]GBO40016.1 hypothetical protein AVEN_142104-1 [Araneus ventricosus]GBO40017.1 hypothetical protein AVEN_161138-1 [Araneus ventricosus]GBO40020.1 hypothetical protein AVEN_170211-1 [Araneus ventricosus]
MPHIPHDRSDVADLWLGLLTGPQTTGLFLLGAHEILVYEVPVDSAEDLIARIVVATDKINTTPGICERVPQSFLRRCELCNDTRVRHSEHLLWVYL